MKQIGVVIPVFNGERTIEKSIKSLLCQTYKDWVAIIINDGSIDDTKEILDRYNSDDRFYITHFEQNRGRSYARQTGLEMVRELKLKYMCMLDADDWYYPDKLKYQFGIMEENEELLLLSSSIGVTSNNQKLFKVIKPFSKFKTLKFEEFTDFTMLPHASSIIKIVNVDKSIKYNVELKFSEDKDFLRKLLIGNYYAFDPKILYVYNRDDSFSLEKYNHSMYYNFVSFKNLKQGLSTNLKYYIKNKFKYFLVAILCFIGRKDLYMSRIGIDPSELELLKHNENKNLFK